MKRILLHLLLSSAIIFGCANIQEPSGGPKDTTPPFVLSIAPKNNSMNFHGKKIEIEFSKYMDNNKVNESVFLSPSKKISYDWSGKDLEITIDEELDSNTTYSLLLGTDYTDRKGNKPEQAYTLVFSTGNKIDSSEIKGMLISDKPAGVFIWAYRLEDFNPDTINIFKQKPQYRTQVGSNGTFSLKALKTGTYRLFAIRDKQNDGKFDEASDDFGTYYQAIKADSSHSSAVQLRIGGPVDKSKIMLFGAEPQSRKVLTALFSKSIDTLSVKPDCFQIIDSLTKQIYKPLAAVINQKNASQIDLTLPFAPDTGKKYFLIANPDPTLSIRDTSGNTMADTACKVSFIASSDIDSSEVKMTKIAIADSSTEVSPDFALPVRFSAAVNADTLANCFSLIQAENSQTRKLRLLRKTDNYFVLSPEEKLAPSVKYEFYINNRFIRPYNGYKLKDTTYKIRFTTKDTRNYGGLSGRIEGIFADSAYSDKRIITLTQTDLPIKLSFSCKVGKDGSWNFDDLPAGNYKASVYCDSNGNGVYDYGEPFPYRFAEPFMETERKIEIKPRWKIKDLIIK